ncbi:MAG: cytochrome b/b6 domain-containing protein [bacterium]|nr:cytochrome b/b6 domain-containing protein [bacterium]
MKSILVWDIPNRIFHWIFAGSLALAMAIGFVGDDDAPFFRLHMFLGMVVLFMLVIRLVLGLADYAIPGSPASRCKHGKSQPTSIARPFPRPSTIILATIQDRL